jgi:DNA recombination protein Rad52
MSDTWTLFTDAQKAALSAKLDPRFVAQRTQAGRSLSYIEGWHAIAEANRIFGFDGWERETVELRETSRELVQTQKGDQWRVSYLAKVRVTVGRTIVRDGTGYGSGMANPISLGDAIESAAKEAETDAMKRALMTFGNPFGLALYDKTQANVAPKRDKDAIREDGTKSSAALKREGAWDKLMFRVSRDLGDVKSLRQLEMVRSDYREEAKREGWTRAWLETLANEFDTFEDGLKKTLVLEAG